MDPIVILISANAEWNAICQILQPAETQKSPYGEWFLGDGGSIFFHGGWGKIAAAGSTQYAIDRWQPEIIINLGTCGGFEGAIARGEIILAESTVVYDIIEQMGDLEEHIDHYTTTIDLSWLDEGTPIPVYRGRLVSGDRDLLPDEIQGLQTRYGAAVGDWESGAIAWVAAQNHTPLLILRGVTDLVSISGGEAYGNSSFFAESSKRIMERLVKTLPDWIRLWQNHLSDQDLGSLV